ncbi:MAG: hypothetical protein ACRENZ_04120 [Thermodesulfobacteriota bacterium]
MARITFLAIIGIFILTISGCAILRINEAQQTDRLLSAAGFKMLPADTPQKDELLSSLTPLKLQYRIRDDKTLFFYSDPYDCKCVYTGDQSAYDRFEKLAVEAEIAKEEQEAALMNEETAMEFESWGWGWLGGPWGWL